MSIALGSATTWVPCVEIENEAGNNAAKINSERTMIVSTYYANLPSTISNQLNTLIYNISLTTANVFFPHTGLFFSDIAVANALARW